MSPAPTGGRTGLMAGESFGDVLRSHRERLNLTQEALAQRAGLGVRTVREFEAGRVRRPRGQSLRLLAQALALDEDARAGFISLAYDAVQPSGEAAPPVPRQLPAEVAGFTGRQDLLRALDEVLSEDGLESSVVRIAVVVGMAGIGKTAVSVRWAHRVASRFPDGHLFIDLQGYSVAGTLRPIDALARFLRALGLPAEQIPVDQDEAAALYRSVLAGRRVLVVLDNAASAEQVRPLLPGSAGSFVLVTSRDRLTGLIAREGATELAVGGLSAGESQQLLAGILGADRVAADLSGTVRLADLCAHLPLALRIAAANLAIDRDSTISEFADRLESGSLAELQLPGDQHRAVLAAFDLSYQAQPAAAGRMFRLLGLIPGPDFTIDVAAALAGVSTAEAATLLDRLVTVHLVQRPAKGRFSLHDLLCRYARDRAKTDPDGAVATSRLVHYYLAGADAAAERLYPYMFRLDVAEQIKALHPSYADNSAALAWLDAERHNVLAALDLATRVDPRTACALAVALRGYLCFRGDTLGGVQTANAALAAAADDGTIEARTAAETTAAVAYYNVGDHARAINHGEAALRLAREAGIGSAEAPALATLAPILLRAGEPAAAIERVHEALDVARGCDRREAEGPLLVNLAIAYGELGRLRDAADIARTAVESDRECDSLVNESLALIRLGEACHLLGDLHDAATHLHRSLVITRQIGNPATEAPALAAHAAVLADQGRLAEATLDAQAAIAALGHQDHWTEVECRNRLGGVMRLLGRHRDAAEEHARALELVGAADSCAPAAIALIGLSDGHRSLGEIAEAAACAQEAVELSRAVGYRMLEGQAHVAAAEVDLLTGRRGAARDHAMRAIEIHHDTGHRLGEARAKVVLGHADAHTRVGNWQDAAAIFQRCGAAVDAAATENLIRADRGVATE
jgi:tetratricopeptide (TPR) repeat protein/transcriptional regulator with XRE-family HTH domain